jgi:tRNA dimethylallyltransferase
MRSVGYRQLWNHLDRGDALENAVERAIIATRQLAKRQLTWLRRRPDAAWLDAMHSNVAKHVIFALSERMAAIGVTV